MKSGYRIVEQTEIMIIMKPCTICLFSVKSHHALVKHLKLLQNHEDFELKKLLVNIVTVLTQDCNVLPVSILYSHPPHIDINILVCTWLNCVN